MLNSSYKYPIFQTFAREKSVDCNTEIMDFGHNPRLNISNCNDKNLTLRLVFFFFVCFFTQTGRSFQIEKRKTCDFMFL